MCRGDQPVSLQMQPRREALPPEVQTQCSRLSSITSEEECRVEAVLLRLHLHLHRLDLHSHLARGKARGVRPVNDARVAVLSVSVVKTGGKHGQGWRASGRKHQTR